jgi:3-oxoadipate enol-lactonase
LIRSPVFHRYAREGLSICLIEKLMLTQLNSHRVAFDLLGGDRDPVVCFAHSLATDSGMWAEQVPSLLAAGFRVLRIDMRGHGGSTATNGGYTMDELAGDVSQVVSLLGIDSVHYVGLSIGGMFGLAFALNHSEQLKSLMICDAIPASMPNAPAIWGPRVDAVCKADSLKPVSLGTIDRWLSTHYKEKNPRRWQQIFDTILGTTPKGFIGGAAAMQRFNFIDRLPQISAPSIVVCGADDPVAPPAQNERIAKLIPHAQFVVIPNALHLPNIEDPATFNRIMLNWLKRNTN